MSVSVNYVPPAFLSLYPEKQCGGKRSNGDKDTNLKPILTSLFPPAKRYKYNMTFQSCQTLSFKSLKFIMINICLYYYVTF